MRLLFLCKRRPQNRDLMDRPYGRFHYLPVELAKCGHEVTTLLVGHQGLPSEQRDLAGVRWISHDLRRLGPIGLQRTLTQEAHRFAPDAVIGCSDTWAAWLAHRLAKALDASLVIDAYDNFEAYMPWNFPLHWLWRRSVRNAALVTAAGPQLAQRLQLHRHWGHDVEILPMAADPEFMPQDKSRCRQQLGLPHGTPLMGYVGSWARNRGTDMLLDAFRRARATRPDLQLVLSGRPPEYALNEPGVIGSGYVPDAQLPLLINALDVACIITADTGFGRYSYPAKLCEAMACGVPVVATATEPVRWMLGDRHEHLVAVGDAGEFAGRILDMLAVPRVDYGSRPTWTMQAQRLDQLLTSVSRQNR